MIALCLAAKLREIARRYFAFNQFRRDAWVRQQASLIPAGSKVLDVGAGSCPYRRWFEHCRYLTHDATKLDAHQLMGRAGYGDIDFVSDITSIPAASGSIDVILCTEVLEHVPEPIKAVQEFARLLKSGGKLLITAPLGSGLHQEPYHYYGGYTPHWYRRFLGAAGFRDVSVLPNGGFFEFFGQESQRFALLLCSSAGVRNPLRVPAVALAPFFRWGMPLLCAALADIDQQQEFTVGYHVTATKDGSEVRQDHPSP